MNSPFVKLHVIINFVEEEEIKYKNVLIDKFRIVLVQETGMYFGFLQYAEILKKGLKGVSLSPTKIKLEDGTELLVLESFEKLESMLS